MGKGKKLLQWTLLAQSGKETPPEGGLHWTVSPVGPTTWVKPHPLPRENLRSEVSALLTVPLGTQWDREQPSAKPAAEGMNLSFHLCPDPAESLAKAHSNAGGCGNFGVTLSLSL